MAYVKRFVHRRNKVAQMAPEGLNRVLERSVSYYAFHEAFTSRLGMRSRCLIDQAATKLTAKRFILQDTFARYAPLQPACYRAKPSLYRWISPMRFALCASYRAHTIPTIRQRMAR